jgi:hypothetical protein
MKEILILFIATSMSYAVYDRILYYASCGKRIKTFSTILVIVDPLKHLTKPGVIE